VRPLTLGTWPSNLVFAITCVMQVYKFEEDWTKIVIASVNETFVQTEKQIQTDIHSDTHSSDFASDRQ